MNDASGPSLAADRPCGGSPLRRALGPGLLVFYGMGVIVGAGIYVLIGAVVAVAGSVAPWSFAIAGAIAALTALSYAELAARFPEAAGAPAYIREAFGSDLLSRATGLVLVVVVAVSTASIARGCAVYLQGWLAAPDAALAAAVVLLALAVACLGVCESVGAAAVMTAVEIGGLLLVIAAGWSAGAEGSSRIALLPAPAAWPGMLAGAFLAFFAFLGFENLANMAEEARAPGRTLPRAILLSVALSTALYVAVAVAALSALAAAELAAAEAPLLAAAARAAWFPAQAFVLIAVIAVGNGVLIELVMLGRLLYGMARRGWLPAALARVSEGRRAPVPATLAGGAVVLALTLALPFVSLVALSSGLSLLVLAAVNAALWRLHRTAPRAEGFRAPRWTPPLAALASLALAAGVFMA